ncbi:uncharacterized protein [Leptinotarsa decemlineata]|uniref:uncharacterized protein n=1 Tax=Leptinotarsa decemlineata TaxID=7539 RepID=UPI003D307C4B
MSQRTQSSNRDKLSCSQIVLNRFRALNTPNTRRMDNETFAREHQEMFSEKRLNKGKTSQTQSAPQLGLRAMMKAARNPAIPRSVAMKKMEDRIPLERTILSENHNNFRQQEVLATYVETPKVNMYRVYSHPVPLMNFEFTRPLSTSATSSCRSSRHTRDEERFESNGGIFREESPAGVKRRNVFRNTEYFGDEEESPAGVKRRNDSGNAEYFVNEEESPAGVKRRKAVQNTGCFGSEEDIIRDEYLGDGYSDAGCVFDGSPAGVKRGNGAAGQVVRRQASRRPQVRTLSGSWEGDVRRTGAPYISREGATEALAEVLGGGGIPGGHPEGSWALGMPSWRARLLTQIEAYNELVDATNQPPVELRQKLSPEIPGAQVWEACRSSRRGETVTEVTGGVAVARHASAYTEVNGAWGSDVQRTRLDYEHPTRPPNPNRFGGQSPNGGR